MTPEERFARIDQHIEKNTAGIRDLIAVARTLVESQKETDEKFKMLITIQEDTWKMIREGDKRIDKLGEKLDRVADILERFLKGLQKPNGSE